MKVENLEQNVIENLLENTIPEQPYGEIIASRTFINPTLVSPLTKGGKAIIGEGNNTMRFQPDLGLWLGSANFENAPFRVNMIGNLIANNVDITGRLVAGPGSFISGMYVGDISANRITTGILTGRTIRTATSGERIEMDADWHDLIFFDSLGRIQGKIDSTTESLRITGNQAGQKVIIFQRDSGGIMQIAASFSILNTFINGNLVPLTGGSFDLGTSSFRWRDIWLSRNLVIGGNAWISGNTISANVEPINNNVFDLGISGMRWRDLYLSRALKLLAVSWHSWSAGDIINWSAAGVDQFRGRPGLGIWTGSFNMTAV